MAEYIKQEMCDLNGTGEKPVYYRMKIQRNMDMGISWNGSPTPDRA